MNENENARLEFLSDGIFAIAITLLILEIKVPSLSDAETAGNLGAALRHLYPSYFGYVFSFLMIGVYWINHNQIFKLYRRGDHIFILLNIFFLMCVAFLPFPTAVLAEYLTNPEFRQTAITFYTFGLFLPAFSWLTIWLYASRNHRLIDENLPYQFVRRQTAKYAVTNALYLSAVLLSLWNGAAALFLCVGLTLLYLIPSKKPKSPEISGQNIESGNFLVFVVLGVALFPLTTAAQQETKNESVKPSASPTVIGYKINRQDEDWASLKDKTKRADWSDALKYISLGSESRYLSIGGEVRPFYEFYKNENWGGAPKDDNGWLLERYMFHADFHLGKKSRVFAQVKSGLINNRIGGARGSDLDKMDLHQLFFDYQFLDRKNKSLMLRAGRQEISFGSSRLVGVREGPNVRQSFDGVRLSAKSGGWTLDAFVVKPVSTDKGFFDDKPQNQVTFGGFYAVSPVGFLTKKGKVDFYYFGLDKKLSRFNQGAAREIRQTIGTRIWNNQNALDYNFEFAYQFGSFGAGLIKAWTAASDTGYTFREKPLKPRFGLKADATSGDKNPNDKNLQTFNALFPRGAYFGQFSPVGPYNHTDLHTSVTLSPTSKSSVNFDWINFWRTSRRDGIYNVAGSLIRSGNLSRAKYTGEQFAVEADYKLDRHTTLTANYSRFNVGKFLVESPPAENTNYFAAWLTYKF